MSVSLPLSLLSFIQSGLLAVMRLRWIIKLCLFVIHTTQSNFSAHTRTHTHTLSPFGQYVLFYLLILLSLFPTCGFLFSSSFIVIHSPSCNSTLPLCLYDCYHSTLYCLLQYTPPLLFLSIIRCPSCPLICRSCAEMRPSRRQSSLVSHRLDPHVLVRVHGRAS